MPNILIHWAMHRAQPWVLGPLTIPILLMRKLSLSLSNVPTLSQGCDSNPVLLDFKAHAFSTVILSLWYGMTQALILSQNYNLGKRAPIETKFSQISKEGMVLADIKTLCFKRMSNLCWLQFLADLTLMITTCCINSPQSHWALVLF